MQYQRKKLLEIKDRFLEINLSAWSTLLGPLNAHLRMADYLNAVLTVQCY